jgi:hypothetical protein
MNMVGSKLTKLLPLLAVLWSFLAGAQAQTTYNSPDGHWSIVVPKDWRVASAQELETINSGANEMGSRIKDTPPIRYVLEMTPIKPDGRFVLVQVAPGIPSGLSFEDWRSAMEKQSGRELKRVEKAFPAEIGTASFGQAVIEVGRHRMLMTMDMQGPNGVSLKALSTMQWGVGESINIHAYATKDTFESHRAALASIADSFQFAPGFEHTFAPPGTGANNRNFAGMLGAAVAVGVWLLIWLRNRRA